VKDLSVASVVVTAMALMSAPVQAADMAPIPMAPVPIALPFDWEGFYVGVHTGAATDDVSFTQTNLTGPVAPSSARHALALRRSATPA
jgi:hypothetical protein